MRKNLDNKHMEHKGERGHWKIVITLLQRESQAQNPNMGVLFTTLGLHK